MPGVCCVVMMRYWTMMLSAYICRAHSLFLSCYYRKLQHTVLSIRRSLPVLFEKFCCNCRCLVQRSKKMLIFFIHAGTLSHALLLVFAAALKSNLIFISFCSLVSTLPFRYICIKRYILTQPKTQH